VPSPELRTWSYRVGHGLTSGTRPKVTTVRFVARPKSRRSRWSGERSWCSWVTAAHPSADLDIPEAIESPGRFGPALKELRPGSPGNSIERVLYRD
jgi:hypothetical protein